MKNVGCRSRRKPPLSFAEDENDLTCFEHTIQYNTIHMYVYTGNHQAS